MVCWCNWSSRSMTDQVLDLMVCGVVYSGVVHCRESTKYFDGIGKYCRLFSRCLLTEIAIRTFRLLFGSVVYLQNDNMVNLLLCGNFHSLQRQLQWSAVDNLKKYFCLHFATLEVFSIGRYLSWVRGPICRNIFHSRSRQHVFSTYATRVFDWKLRNTNTMSHMM